MSQGIRREVYYVLAAVGLASVIALVLALDSYTGQSELRSELRALERAQQTMTGQSEMSEADFQDRVEQAIESIIAEREQAQQQGGQAAPQQPQAMPSSMGDNGAIYGAANAPVTLFVFADYNCPYCAQFNPTVKDFVDQSDGEVNYIHLNYPVFGGASVDLANASECVQQEIGPEAHFDFVDAAYESDTWQGATQRAGLDPESIEACVSESRYQSRIDSNLAEGQNFGVTGTPTTLVRNNNAREGTVVSGAVPVGNLEAAVQEVLTNGAN